MTIEVTEKNTKAEILDALKQAKEALKEAKAKKVSTSKDVEGEIQIKKAESAFKAAASVPFGDVSTSFASFKNSLNAGLIEFQKQIEEKMASIKELDEAIKIGEEKLKLTHDLNVEGDSLISLVEAKKALSEKFRVEHETLTQQRTEEYNSLKAKLQKEVDEIRANWEIEKRKYLAQFAEEKNTIKSEWSKEKAEYEYNRDRERALEKDKWDDQFKTEQRAKREEFSAKEADLDRREAIIGNSEEKIAVLENRIVNLTAEMEKAVGAAEKKGEAIAKNRAEAEAKLREAEFNSSMQIKDFKINTLEETILSLKQQVAILEARTSESSKQVQEIAKEAITGASKSVPQIFLSGDNQSQAKK